MITVAKEGGVEDGKAVENDVPGKPSPKAAESKLPASPDATAFNAEAFMAMEDETHGFT